MRIVLRRLALLGGVSAVLVLPTAALTAKALPPPKVARSIYVVRPDPRLCPSPLCGGYWLSRANHARTRCHDGLLRPRCYVAIAIGEVSRRPLTGLPENSLVRAVLGPWTFEGLGDLGAVVVADVWKPVGSASPTGGFFRARDTGIRCVRAPCFSIRAWRVNRASRITVSELDLQAARPTPDELARAQAALTTPEGVFVSGRVDRTAENGRLLRTSQVFLRVATPRA
jgi:hypothetical protein